jgi:hypothetical protein
MSQKEFSMKDEERDYCRTLYDQLGMQADRRIALDLATSLYPKRLGSVSYGALGMYEEVNGVEKDGCKPQKRRRSYHVFYVECQRVQCGVRRSGRDRRDDQRDDRRHPDGLRELRAVELGGTSLDDPRCNAQHLESEQEQRFQKQQEILHRSPTFLGQDGRFDKRVRIPLPGSSLAVRR